MTSLPPGAAADGAAARDPQPTVTSVQINVVQSSEGPMVALWMHQPTGVTVAFLPAETAQQIAAALQAAARQVRTGLEIASNGHPVA